MKALLEKIGTKALRQIDPETAHHIALKALNLGLAPLDGVRTSPRLATQIAQLNLPNPIGLAAGFDKNAIALAPLSQAGFGWIEVGAATPLAQQGNPKPRLFRLNEDHAAINRFGFNNDGMEQIAQRLAKRPRTVPIGLNLGANKDSANRAEDFARVLAHCAPYVDFATVNVSSPNTEKLRDLQGPSALAALLDGVMQACQGIPVFLKIAPDLSDQDLSDIAKVAEDAHISAIIATNTTLDRANLSSRHANEKGGLSGQPLFEKSTRVLAKLHQRTSLPLVGVGGIATAEQAYTKIKAGASALQLYTGLVFGGLSLASKIAQELDTLLERDGYASVADAVGQETEHWVSSLMT